MFGVVTRKSVTDGSHSPVTKRTSTNVRTGMGLEREPAFTPAASSGMLASANRAVDKALGVVPAKEETKHNSTLCLSLLPLFDFTQRGKVSGSHALRAPSYCMWPRV